MSVFAGDHEPIVAYDKNSIKIIFHVGKDRPRPDVAVVAISVMSTNSTSVKAFTFQAAVPKVRLAFYFLLINLLISMTPKITKMRKLGSSPLLKYVT